MTLDFLTPSLVANSVIVTQVLQVLCQFQDVQKKVQDEIDHVIGQGTLPTLDDRVKYVTVATTMIYQICYSNNNYFLGRILAFPTLKQLFEK